MRRIMWITGCLIVAIYIIATMIVAVDEDEIVVITQFGKPIRTITEAGPAIKLPDPIESPIRLDKRLQVLKTTAGELVTRDRRNIILGTFVIWRINDGERFIQSVRNKQAAQGRLEDLVSSELGSAIGNVPLSAFLTTTIENNQFDRIMLQVTTSTKALALREFGIDVLMIRPHQLGFPQQNLSAVYRRMMSERERIARRYRAEGQEQAAKIRAQTELEVRELLADAYRQAQTIKGEGEAQATKEYSMAYQVDPDFYRLSRYQQAYEKIIGKNTTLLLSTESPLLRYLTSIENELSINGNLSDNGKNGIKNSVKE